MLNKVRERINIFIVKNPSKAILIIILIINVVLIAVAAGLISLLAPSSLAHAGFWESVFYTISMILDAGCMEYVIEDIGQTGVAVILLCLGIVVIGMITFTGAVIGYVTNYISGFIENSRSGIRPLRAAGHTVILNWNSRASEIINDLLYTGRRELVVVLANQDSRDIQREVGERISASLKSDQKAMKRELEAYRGRLYLRRALRNRVTVIVREGETFSTKQLNDIAISQARTVILLSKELRPDATRGEITYSSANTVKALVQVAEITAGEDSADHQTIIVEVEDDQTASLVERVAAHKERFEKCHIIPVYVNRVLGQILSQFSIMPELNTVYSELFSNRGAEFFFRAHPREGEETKLVQAYLDTHRHAIPLTVMQTLSGRNAYYMANSDGDCERSGGHIPGGLRVRLNRNYQMLPRNIVIIGHNSKCRELMNGFSAFRGEHKLEGQEILNITMIDDREDVSRYDRDPEYPYVTRTVVAGIHEADRIRTAIEEAIDSHPGDTSLLILSDDRADAENMDSAALTYLVYVQDIIRKRKRRDPNFDPESIDVIVEIIDPKNYDVVRNYSADNVVISNRYISKMVTQIGRKQELFEFYTDILTYDVEGAEEYKSKELYIREAELFFAKGRIPERCSAAELIRGVYEASPENNKTILLGYTSPGGKMVLFAGDQESVSVELAPGDKLILFCNH